MSHSAPRRPLAAGSEGFISSITRLFLPGANGQCMYNKYLLNQTEGRQQQLSPQFILKYGWLEKNECNGTYQRCFFHALDYSGGISLLPMVLYDSQLFSLPCPSVAGKENSVLWLTNCASHDSVGQPVNIDLFFGAL